MLLPNLTGLAKPAQSTDLAEEVDARPPRPRSLWTLEDNDPRQSRRQGNYYMRSSTAQDDRLRKEDSQRSDMSAYDEDDKDDALALVAQALNKATREQRNGFKESSILKDLLADLRLAMDMLEG